MQTHQTLHRRIRQETCEYPCCTLFCDTNVKAMNVFIRVSLFRFNFMDIYLALSKALQSIQFHVLCSISEKNANIVRIIMRKESCVLVILLKITMTFCFQHTPKTVIVVERCFSITQINFALPCKSCTTLGILALNNHTSISLINLDSVLLCIVFLGHIIL